MKIRGQQNLNTLDPPGLSFSASCRRLAPPCVQSRGVAPPIVERREDGLRSSTSAVESDACSSGEPGEVLGLGSGVATLSLRRAARGEGDRVGKRLIAAGV